MAHEPTRRDPTGAYPGRVIPGIQADNLSPITVAAVAFTAGFRGAALAEAVAHSFRENGAHNSTAQNLNTDDSVDSGLWQINSVHYRTCGSIRDLFNAHHNANCAYNLSSHGTDFQPWAGEHGTWRALLPQAHEAIRQMDAHGGAETWLSNNPVDPAADHSPGVVSQVTNGIIGGWVGDLKDAIVPYILRAFEMVGGVVLILMGLFFIAKDMGIAPATPPIPIPIPV